MCQKTQKICFVEQDATTIRNSLFWKDCSFSLSSSGVYRLDSHLKKQLKTLTTVTFTLMFHLVQLAHLAYCVPPLETTHQNVGTGAAKISGMIQQDLIQNIQTM